MKFLRSWLCLVGLVLFIASVQAHYNMLLPSAASARKGQPVAITYQWGHPFEQELFNAPTPVSVTVLGPNGKKTDIGKAGEAIALPAAEGKKAGAFRYAFTPPERGDYVVVLNAPPIWMEEDQEFFHDTVKVVLHVQAQQGWDAGVGTGFELTPLTRPYGLQPGMVFQVQALLDGKPVPRALVEVERYNATPPKQLPPDEQITRSAKTDPNGVATVTLTEPGWWVVTAIRDGGEKERNGKKFPVKQRASFWVFVDIRAGTP